MDISEEDIKVVIVHPTVHFFFFSFVYAMYLNIASYLNGKKIKSKMGNKLYLRIIFTSICLNWLDLHDCHTMTLKQSISSEYVMVDFIYMGLLDLGGARTENYKMKISCPQWNSNPGPSAYEANALSVVLLELITIDHL